METHIIENDFLKLEVSEKGAELNSLFNKKNKKQYLWQADPKIWGRRAPVLFPIVGRLYQDTYLHNGTTYKMSQHGFARDQEFYMLLSGESHLSFLLTESPETLAKYPFEFNLYISYTLDNNKIVVEYEVQNTGPDEMFFSIGGHPAFNTPLGNSEKYEDYVLEFEKDEFVVHPLNGNYQSGTTQSLKLTDRKLRVDKSLFQNDAIIFKSNDLKKVSLKHDKSGNGVTFSTNMPYFGIWSPKDTDRFVCLEPWAGIADSEKTTELKEKEGINKLAPGAIFKCSYEIEVL